MVGDDRIARGGIGYADSTSLSPRHGTDRCASALEYEHFTLNLPLTVRWLNVLPLPPTTGYSNALPRHRLRSVRFEWNGRFMSAVAPPTDRTPHLRLAGGRLSKGSTLCSRSVIANPLQQQFFNYRSHLAHCSRTFDDANRDGGRVW